MGTEPKSGPYTIDELFAFWQTIVDGGYSQPFVQALRGAGSIDADADIPTASALATGYEVFTQAMAQAKRASQAVDRNAQAMFIMPWSGQSDRPAMGGARALVSLTAERSLRLELPLTIPAGIVVVEEEATDMGDSGGEAALTGRRYMLAEQLCFVPGERGPKQVLAVAEKEGYGYNNPAPDTITSLVQPGGSLSNDRASVIPGSPSHRLLCRPEPDVVSPDNVGQLVEFLGGANTGQVRRMLAYQAADPAIPHGGVAVLARTAVLRLSGIAGTFAASETVVQVATGGEGTLSYLGGSYAILEAANDLFAAGAGFAGLLSGATATIDMVVQTPGLVAETSTATWRVMKWGTDLGLTLTNALRPVDGAIDMLGELGRERDIGRAPGETDDAYRERVHQLPDTVSPNAIRRAANRVLLEFGVSGCLREVGTELFPGLFFDGDGGDVDPRGAFAFDMDFTVEPRDRYKVLVDDVSSRAFFLMIVPPLNVGEYGCAYDAGPCDAYDAAPWLAFYDGFAVTAAVVYGNIWQALNDARAGGVGFELVQDSLGCY